MSDRFYRMPAAGGGYELALAMDYLILIDDGNAAVSLPEIPLLAVLPGTGGLTRIVDKRKGRREEWLPDKDDLEFLLSLMEQVTEPGKFAHWIAPPRAGINGKPGDFEYVRIAA